MPERDLHLEVTTEAESKGLTDADHVRRHYYVAGLLDLLGRVTA